MRMARFCFAIPLVRVIYFVLTGVFIVLCFIAFLVLYFLLMCCYGVMIDELLSVAVRAGCIDASFILQLTILWLYLT